MSAYGFGVTISTQISNVIHKINEDKSNVIDKKREEKRDRVEKRRERRNQQNKMSNSKKK